MKPQKSAPRNGFKAHAQYSAPKPESVDMSHTYAITVNPEYQPVKHDDVHQKITVDGIKDWYRQVSETIGHLKYCVVLMQLEISSGSRLHFHGFIRITDVANFYFYDIPRLKSLGSYEIDTVSDHVTWTLYMLKQAGFMIRWAEQHGIQSTVANWLYPPAKERKVQSIEDLHQRFTDMRDF